jgi:hypothetical protein
MFLHWFFFNDIFFKKSVAIYKKMFNKINRSVLTYKETGNEYGCLSV